MMIPPVTAAGTDGAETFSVPPGVSVVLKLEGEVTLNDITQP
jgi:hypothetical protein